jgi:hypothetical protein
MVFWVLNYLFHFLIPLYKRLKKEKISGIFSLDL